MPEVCDVVWVNEAAAVVGQIVNRTRDKKQLKHNRSKLKILRGWKMKLHEAVVKYTVVGRRGYQKRKREGRSLEGRGSSK